MENGYSLSDVASVVGNKEDGMFGNSGMWIFALLILLLLGNGGGLFGGNRYADSALNTYATASSQQDILFGQKFSSLDNKIDRLANGLCDSTYALNNAIMGEGRSLQTQLANCCCENQRNVDSLRFDMSNYAASINANIDNKFAAMEKAQLEQTIANQANQINQLYLQQQLCGIVRYPNSLTYTAGNSPFCNYGGCNGMANI